MRPEFFTNQYGLIVDYLAEFMREMRKRSFGDAINKFFKLGRDLNQRDTIAVKHTVSGLLKLLYPHEDYDKEAVRRCLEYALESRRRVKEQLKKIGGMEFYDVHFSYVDQETLEEKFISVPEQGGGSLIPDGPLNPGVLHTVAQMLEEGATHIAVATDHVIESFRNDLWPGYKTGAGIEPALWAQFHPLEEALVAMGVVTWPMVELEADDALASAAYLAGRAKAVEKVCIWTPDKDLAQCVREDRVVQIDRRGKAIRDAAGVRAKFGVAPELIPDWLALVGDAADGYPGISGIGAVGAARLLERHGPIEAFPPSLLGERQELALLFKRLATLRTDAKLFRSVETLRWRGPTEAFVAWTERGRMFGEIDRGAAEEVTA
jgi:hypothetical protein